MITLAAADTLAAGASVATQVTSTVFGMELNAGTEVYKVLDQRQLAAAPATIYTAPASTTAFIKTITAVNNDASVRTAQYFRGGTAAANAITPPVSIPAGGFAIWEDGQGWSTYDANGSKIILTSAANPLAGLTGVIRADAGVASVDSDVTDIVAAATLTAAGKAELATDAEVQALADTGRIVTPSNLGALSASLTQRGIVELATDAETLALADTGRAVTPSNLGALNASLTQEGLVELATDAETLALTDTARAVTPSNLGALNAGDAQEGLIELAIQSEMETATDVVRAVVPGRMKFHPGVCKGWGMAAGSGSLTTGYNMDAVTDTGTGRLGVNITTDISSANYAILTSLASVATTLTVATVDNGGLVYNASQAAGAFGIWDYDDTATTHVAQDPQSYFWAIFGDFA